MAMKEFQDCAPYCGCTDGCYADEIKRRYLAEIERLRAEVGRVHNALLTIELDCGSAWRAYDGTPHGQAFKSTADFARATRAGANEQNGNRK